MQAPERNQIDVGLGKYMKRAFLNQWNLLAFLGGLGFAMLTGHPDVFIPLVWPVRLLTWG